MERGRKGSQETKSLEDVIEDLKRKVIKAACALKTQLTQTTSSGSAAQPENSLIAHACEPSSVSSSTNWAAAAIAYLDQCPVADASDDSD